MKLLLSKQIKYIIMSTLAKSSEIYLPLLQCFLNDNLADKVLQGTAYQHRDQKEHPLIL